MTQKLHSYICTQENNTISFYNMNDPWTHYANLKKPVPTDHMMYDSIYMKSPEQENL